jgi:hypothetical protein
MISDTNVFDTVKLENEVTQRHNEIAALHLSLAESEASWVKCRLGSTPNPSAVILRRDIELHGHLLELAQRALSNFAQ